ncbi:MAG TPA: sigma-70 family RNA polymerase sigma factor, partial [Opitutales bacterium]|nr:sigma-70 family RNA polymerase sigma factor [Opitutales bacterium]
MMTDHELLRQYAECGDEAAFTEIVRRRVDFVYSAALRLTAQDTHLAQDVTQKVFADLARKAGDVAGHATITGWLHTSARYAAANAVRGEQRRRTREQEAYAMHDQTTGGEEDWDQVAPLLDAAVGSLHERDRAAVLMRFFDGKTYAEIGEAVGLKENAARQRVERALERMRGYFSRHGVTVSVALLATAITVNSVKAAPSGLAVTVAGASLTSAGSAVVSHSIFQTLVMSLKTKIGIAAGILLVAAIATTAYQQQQITQLRRQLTVATAQAATAAEVAVQPDAKQMESRLKSILNEPGVFARIRDLLLFSKDLSPAQARAMLEAVSKLPPSDKNDAVKLLLAQRLAEGDPKAALAWARTIQSAELGNAGIEIIYDTWAGKDPEAALAAVSHESSSVQRDIQTDALYDIALTNPQRALDLLHKLPANQQSMPTAGIFLAWATMDSPAAATAVLQLPLSQARNASILAVAGAWANRDAAAALAWVNNLPAGVTRTSALGEIAATMATHDINGATQILDALPGGTNRNNLIKTIATNWALQDPEAATAWVGQVADGQAFDQSMQAILQQMSDANPPAAAGLLQKIPDASVRDSVIPKIATSWAQQDFDAALTWAKELPAAEGTTRNTAIANVIAVWAQNDPVTAATYVQKIPDDPNFRTLTEQVARNWAQADPTAALAWANSLTDIQSAADNARRTVLSIYAQANPQAAWDIAQQTHWDSS